MAFPRTIPFADGVDALSASTFNDLESRAAAALIKVNLSNLPPSVVTSSSATSPILFPDAFGTVDPTGVNDSNSAFQAAINAISVAGGGVLTGKSGATYRLSDLVPASNVTLWLYGCTIKMKAGAAHGVFFWNSGLVQNFQIFGGNFLGTGTETQAQYVFGAENPGSGADIVIQDTYVSTWATSPYFIVNTGHLLVTNNRFKNVGVPSALNTIDVVDRAVDGTYDVVITNNIIDGTGSCGIAYVNTGATTDGDKTIIIANNTVRTLPNCNGGIDIECAASNIGKSYTMIIANNTVIANLAAGFYGLIVSASQNDVRELAITGNVIVCVAGNANSRGMNVQAGGATITGNRILQRTAASLQAVYIGNGRTFTLTGDVNGTTTVANVTGDQSHILNGATVTNANLPTGTWIVSGAGTSTWILSIAATGTVVGTSLVANGMNDDVVFTGNSIHTNSDPSNTAFRFQGLRYAKISNNVFTTDSGSTTSTQSSLRLDNCAWTDLTDNQVNYAAHHGIVLGSSHNCAVEDNTIYNAGESGQNGTGILWTGLTDPGTGINTTRRNRVVDDRSVHKMQNGVAATSLVDVVDNYLLGFTSAAISGAARSKRGNTYKDPGNVSGRAALVTGTVTVSTTEIQASDNVLLSVVAPAGTRGEVQLGTIVGGTSFVINSIQPGTASTVQASDTSTVYWEIRH